MADRHTLHFNQLERFRNWLIKNDWEMKPLSKSQYERATKNKEWVIIYKRDDAKEHYSLTNNSISVVNKWFRELKLRKKIVAEIRDIAGYYWEETRKYNHETKQHEDVLLMYHYDLEEILDRFLGGEE